MTWDISYSVQYSGVVIVGVVYLFLTSWKLTLVMLAVTPVVLLCASRYGRFVRQISKETQDALALASETAEETISNIRTVRSFSKEEFQDEEYASKLN